MAIYFKDPKASPDPAQLKQLATFIKKSSGLWYVIQQFAKVQEIIQIPEKDKPIPAIVALGIEEKLEKKLKSNSWYSKAQAIQYSYELGFSANFKNISTYINHPHILIRREAQLAMVVFLGFKSLPFFASVTYPMSLWQQIRIIEKLKKYPGSNFPNSFEWSVSLKNMDIMELLLRLIASFEMKAQYYIIESAAKHRNQKIAQLATALLAEIAFQDEQIPVPNGPGRGIGADYPLGIAYNALKQHPKI
jgi:hypothetical protein